jgi:hypothetical protein
MNYGKIFNNVYKIIYIIYNKMSNHHLEFNAIFCFHSLQCGEMRI